ncbi:hypothetical protein C8N32_10913 [Rhodovulum imhoffii]|uniref:Ferrochelatase n=1 Tax=Rhodovulum imhoffii TaxID=365340 RepID=A0A2T5BRH5_9RHOB|nr:hypothetical protein [Rhodovulum imhoffii]MBK5934004.1 hypothetical protein [Rhodovulum imhoffii]PTN01889.1 hypothetical protein C8N32_10913 [Rhodovulum imhoffii]
MKKIALAAVLSVAASAAFAGGYSEPVMEPTIEPEVIVEDTASSASGILVPLMALIMFAGVAAS